MRVKQLAVAAVLGIGVLSSSAPTAVLELEVTYTNGGVDFGPICGVPILPTEVCATFTLLGNRFAEKLVTSDAVLTALVEFGDATWTEADVEFFGVGYAFGDIFDLNYRFSPIDTATMLMTVTRNFPLTIEGECIPDGQPFQYTYTDSSHVLTVTCPWDCQATANGVVDVPDLLALLAVWGIFAPGQLCDFDNTNVVNVPDLLALLANWGACP